MLATPENCKRFLFSVRTFFGGIDPELDAILLCSPDYRDLCCYDTWDLQQCLPIFIGVDQNIIKAIASFQRCQDTANVVLSLQKSLGHALDSKNLTDANRYSQTEQGRQWFVEILNSLLDIAKSAYFAGTLPVIGAWEDFNTKVKAHDFLTWALSKNYEIPEFLQSVFFDKTVETTSPGSESQLIDRIQFPIVVSPNVARNKGGGATEQMRNTLSENKTAHTIVQQLIKSDMDKLDIADNMQGGKKVIACLLYSDRPTPESAYRALLEAQKKRNGKA